MCAIEFLSNQPKVRYSIRHGYAKPLGKYSTGITLLRSRENAYTRKHNSSNRSRYASKDIYADRLDFFDGKTNLKSNRNRLILTFLLTTLACAVVGLQPEKASAVTVGVNVGDWAQYSFATTGNSTFTTSFFNLTYAQVTVTAISMPTNITSEVLETFSNGTQETIVNFVDVDNGYGNGSGIFIGANLVAGDLIYPGDVSTDEWAGARINETIIKNYLGSDVSVNHYNRTQIFISPVVNTSASLNFYWYETTGMLAEVLTHVSFQYTTYYEWATVHGMITSVVSEFPTSIVLPLFMAISLLAAIVGYKKIHRRH